MPIYLRQFEVDDCLILCPKAIDAKEAAMDAEHWKQWARFHIESGPAYTALADGRPIAAAGIRLTRPGVGDVWSVPTTDILTHKKGALRCAKMMIEILMKEFELKRLRSESRCGFEASQRFLEHLGFVRQKHKMIGRDSYFYLRMS